MGIAGGFDGGCNLEPYFVRLNPVHLMYLLYSLDFFIPNADRDATDTAYVPARLDTSVPLQV